MTFLDATSTVLNVTAQPQVAVKQGTWIPGSDDGGDSGTGASIGPATRLLMAAPTTATVGVASDPITIGTDGTVAVNNIITPSSTLAGTWTPATATLAPGASRVQFTFTPSATGTAEFSATSSGGLLTERSASCVVAGSSGVDVSARWCMKWDPTLKNFLVSNGTAPLTGAANELRIVTEQSTPAVPNYCTIRGSTGAVDKLTAPWQPTIDSTSVMNGVTGYRTYKQLEIAVDPTNGAKKVYVSRINKAATGYDPLVPYRARAELNALDAQHVRWDEERWQISSVMFDSDMLLINPPEKTNWHICMQFHSEGSAAAGSPPISVRFVGGGGNASLSRFEFFVFGYQNPMWDAAYAGTIPWTDVKAAGSNVKHIYQHQHMASVQPNTHYYFIVHSRACCGFAKPGQDATQVGSLNPDDAFVRIYCAIGAAAPVLLVDHRGFWGYPNDPASVPKDPTFAGYWKGAGQYLKTYWLHASGLDTYTMRSAGMRGYIGTSSPGMSVYDVLQDFRGTR